MLYFVCLLHIAQDVVLDLDNLQHEDLDPRLLHLYIKRIYMFLTLVILTFESLPTSNHAQSIQWLKKKKKA